MYTAQHWLGAYRTAKINKPRRPLTAGGVLFYRELFQLFTIGDLAPVGQFLEYHYSKIAAVVVIFRERAGDYRMSTVQSRPVTPDDLLAMPDAKSFELVRGELVEKNVSVLSSYVEGVLLYKLTGYCKAQQGVFVFPSSLGVRCFLTDPMKVRRPDVFFVRIERMGRNYWHDGFLTISPDLAAEVISPNHLASEVSEKVEEYLAAGVALVWVIEPEVETVVIHRADGSVTKLHKNDELEGESVIPGFRCQVAELFPAEAVP
jgi:Uma2 family endonuclease